MAKRKSLPMKKSKKLFSKTASRVHKVNDYRPYRGGIRL